MDEVVWSYTSVAIRGALLVAVSYATADIAINRYSEVLTPIVEMWLRITSAFLLLVAGIGKLGKSIESWGGQSPPEIANDWAFLILTVLGSFLMFFDIFVVYIRQKLKNDSE